MRISRVADATPSRLVFNPALKGRAKLIRRYAATNLFSNERSTH